MTTRAQQRRLARAGYAAVTVKGKVGWVPQAFAGRVLGQIEAHAEDVSAIIAEPPKPRGRPPKRDAG